MKKLVLDQNASGMIGALLVLPTLYFIISAFLNYGMDISGPWKLIEPIFEKPENKQFGLNINLLISGGPVLAILLNLPQVMHLQIKKEKNEILVNTQFNLKRWHWLVIAAGLFCLVSIFLYLIGENCNC